MADAFTSAKLRLLNDAMHDGRLTPSSRLVFYEIVQHINRVSGNAWPSELRLADRLHIDVKTVKRALPPLQAYGYIEIEKTGRHNTYRPVFDKARKGDKLSPIEGAQGAHVERAPPNSIADILSENRGHFVPAIGDKNGPLSYLREPIKENLSKPDHHEEPFRSCAREGLSRKTDDPIASMPDDGRIHLILIEELGSDTVEALNDIDDGRPLRMLTTLRRDRRLTAIEIDHARSIVAGDLQSNRRALAADDRVAAKATAIRNEITAYHRARQGGAA